MSVEELKGMRINQELVEKINIKFEQLEGRLVLDCDSYNIVCDKANFPEFKLIFGVVKNDLFLTSHAIYPISLTIKLDNEILEKCKEINLNQLTQYGISKIVEN